MKKILKVFMMILCLSPILLLSACKSPNTYLIKAGTSDRELGYFQGTLNNEMEEGKKVTIVAKELFPETNPFICWVKDYSKVVSTSKSMTLTYNKRTAGHYTAVFADSNSGMRFTALTNIHFESENYSSVEYQISSALTSTGSDNFTTFINGKIEVNNDFKTDNKNIVYLGNASSPENFNEYKFKVKVKMINSQNIQTEYEFEFDNLLNYKLFDNAGKCEIKQEVSAIETTLSLTFEKLKPSMFESIKSK